VTQADALRIFETDFRLASGERALYRKILTSDGPIQGRYIAMNHTGEAVVDDQDELVRRFRTHGRRLAAHAARQALTRAGIAASELGGIVVNTCTGYLCPGLSSYVAEALDAGPFVRANDLMGMGCGAALPNLEAARNMLAARPERPVLSIAVEICSATLFMDPDPGVIVSNCIFGDGAAAVVMESGNGTAAGGLVSLVDFEAGLFPEYRSQLHYRTEKHRLRNVLGKRVPIIGAETTARVVDRLLERNGVNRREIAWWAVHPGGTRVLERMQQKFHLPPSALRFSYKILNRYGNMSSPSVLFILEEIVERGAPKKGDKGLMVTFGAGFSAFAALLEF